MGDNSGNTAEANGEAAAKPEVVEDSPFPLTDVDRWVLSQTDEEFHLHDWHELRDIIAAHNLSVLKRKPSDLRRYMAWTRDIKVEYGSMTNYIIKNRLHWGPPPFSYSSSVPFQDPSDYKILRNDWPYGLTPDIIHIVVWSKTPIPTDDTIGDLTPQSRKIVEDFVNRTFVDRLGDASRVLWFKNWVALQSVRALEHIHVLVKDVDDQIIDEWTR
ncbi:hypothetical protein F5884DRAFT_800321 [Xylogone sp. PMI_703]|nr:hypothetical protein F5884DRAFT_800321 [Xylogone sp. PMI_703]